MQKRQRSAVVGDDGPDGTLLLAAVEPMLGGALAMLAVIVAISLLPPLVQTGGSRWPVGRRPRVAGGRHRWPPVAGGAATIATSGRT